MATLVQPDMRSQPPIEDSPAGDGLPHGLYAQGRLGLGTLVSMRWALLGGELLLVLGAAYWRGLQMQLGACLAVIGVGAAYNLFLIMRRSARAPANDRALAEQLGFNIVQLSLLMFLTGGVANPFILLLITPVTLAAATLRPRYPLILGVLATACVALTTVWWVPVQWAGPVHPVVPPSYRWLMASATLTGIAATAGYAWRTAVEAARMELALNVTRTVLAREQRLSALGGLAAAAAHELGTPLATITVVAKELANQTPDGPLREDAELLVSQAARCREILKRLTQTPDTDDVVHSRMTLLQFVNEVIEAHIHTEVRVEALVAGPPGARPPEIRRMPEVLHAMTSFVENAVDFARSEVLVRVRFDNQTVAVEVRDDGPGFSADILTRLGQPYVTSRPGGESSRSGHVGMGLGFFIAKTLLERTGAVVDFNNARGGGASISARWRRDMIEAEPAPGGFELGALDPSPLQ
ncbi:MAG TPA: ActS/PrrB/RegB family redox-sensitive histidine kinase [Caulobacteraceae bacterium]|jgi:two-component system sensor histidine kinase RegB|nr:ActS/PrrB/RegB family redox-sensitive histidine kinase [Caulobacteraceae bacterium]